MKKIGKGFEREREKNMGGLSLRWCGKWTDGTKRRNRNKNRTGQKKMTFREI